MTEAYLEPDAVARLEAAATNLRDRLLVHLLFRLGCRVSELLAVGPGDLDLDAGTVTIQHLKQRLHLSCRGCGSPLGRRHRFCPGCAREVEEAVARELEHRRMRRLPLGPESVAMARDYLARAKRVSDKLFPIGRRQAWKVVTDCARRAELGPLVNPENGQRRGVSPHRLRDAFAVHALKVDDSGVGMRLLQEQLGHVSFDTTARYRKVAGAELRSWYQKLWQAPEAGQERAGSDGASR